MRACGRGNPAASSTRKHRIAEHSRGYPVKTCGIVPLVD